MDAIENVPAGAQSPVRDGIVVLNGQRYMTDAKNRKVPEETVKPIEKLEDQLVRRVLCYADDLNAQIARFKGHCFEDIAAFLDLLAERYGVKSFGGAKGNMTFTSYDGCSKVQVAIADHFTFGPELQVAKQIIDECLLEWAAGSRSEIRALIEHAFEPRAEGKVNAEAILALRRVSIGDERWKLAMGAINDAIRVQGSTTYIRFYRRPAPTARWEIVTIDLAKARAAVNEAKP